MSNEADKPAWLRNEAAATSVTQEPEPQVRKTPWFEPGANGDGPVSVPMRIEEQSSLMLKRNVYPSSKYKIDLDAIPVGKSAFIEEKDVSWGVIKGRVYRENKKGEKYFKLSRHPGWYEIGRKS